MITIKNLRWSNWFSFGEENFIEFNETVLQVIGKNGTGKTSIPMILQEVYYNKNSKNKKKASLPNRYLDAPVLYATSDFTDGSHEYTIDMSRKSSLKLKLFKDGVDISSHTASDTYKTIQGILGLDFKTFSQVMYQSSTDNLEFLTSTDANRKKFLMVLFSLDKYTQEYEKYKKVYSSLSTELAVVKSKMDTISAWIDKHNGTNFDVLEVQEVPKLEDDSTSKIAELSVSLKAISKTNSQINANNQYKDLLSSLDTSSLYEKIDVDLEKKAKILEQAKDLTDTKVMNTATISLKSSEVGKLKSQGTHCGYCKQPLDTSSRDEILSLLEDELILLTSDNHKVEESLASLRKDLREVKDAELKLMQQGKISEEVSRLNTLVDNEMQDDILDADEIAANIQKLKLSLETAKKEIEDVIASNLKASKHNDRVLIILEQIEENRAELLLASEDSIKLTNVLAMVDVIKSAMSPSGLPSYKIDYLIKDLEVEINKYLGKLSGGKFQLSFKLENEKVNVNIIDEGMTIGIEELSAGELARINSATLLAMRKLMAAISSNKINILFLDEIMGTLDDEGKEMLIEVLHKETDLNTLLVSHEFEHPLIPKVYITKENKISRIEYE